MVKTPTYQYRRHRRQGFNRWLGKIPRRKKWQPIPVFLPGESHGQRRLAGYSPWGHKESDMTETTSVQFSSVVQSCLTVCDPMDCSTPGLSSITNSQSLLKLMSIKSAMPSNHLILGHPLLLLPSNLSQHQGLFQ